MRSDKVSSKDEAMETMDSTESAKSSDLETPQQPQQQQQPLNNINTNSISGYLNLEIHPTTGGHFQLQIHKSQSVEQLKRLISRKLNLAKDRICLLYKDRDLRDGSLVDNQVVDGSKVTLLPIVETGLVSQKPEQSVLQALESLSDAQVNTFLEGKAPLNLTMRVGDHMMFIQLQLSTVGNGKLSANKRQHHHPGSSNNVSRRPRVSSSSSDGHVQALGSNRTLAEASRNLSQTLQHFSTQTKTTTNANASSSTTSTNSKEVCVGRGAIIESMQHHGRGVYSGTFSGTLNPALQDSNGNPKRDISTIIHILNDLLGASSSNGNSSRRHRATQTLKPTQHKAHEEAVLSSSVELSRETLMTRGKMEQLQQLLQERRERRRARRQAKAPYSLSPSSLSSSSSNSSSSSASSNWLTTSSSSPPAIVIHPETDSDYIKLSNEAEAVAI
ncbi:hypothetical protein CHUAL_006232 [Chamberlinius hualienensis]